MGVIKHDGPALMMADVSSYTAGGTIMEGPFFRQFSDVEVVDVILRVTGSCPFITRGQEVTCRETQVSGGNCGCYRG